VIPIRKHPNLAPKTPLAKPMNLYRFMFAINTPTNIQLFVVYVNKRMMLVWEGDNEP
jgi:hypothetical protein